MRPEYRDDIDWLRAIAVLAVVAFHFDAPAIYGGFVGVDIFFVISGYLITGIIRSELATGAFSFARFYERRVRRLLPALYAMVVLTAVPSFHYLLTSERAEFFRSVAAVVTFTSNIFFWWQTGYFDHAAVEKPLLHTWSLAVEEQFYLALPVLLWALLRGRRETRFVLPVVLGALALASFALTIHLMRTERSPAAFFMSPPRAWEFLVGSLISLPGLPGPRNAVAQRGGRLLAVTLLAIPILSLRQGPGFPGINALLPCVGAALFIWSGIGRPPQPQGKYSPLHIIRFFGQISYSLYLWHWPLFTFARFSKTSLTLTAGDKIELFALTVAIATLSWRYVEQPFRVRVPGTTRRDAFRLAAASSLALILVSVGGMLLSRVATETDRAVAPLDAYYTYDYRPLYRYGSCFAPASGSFDAACIGLASNKPNLMLWGDSYAAQYFYGLSKDAVPQGLHILQATQPACMPTFSAATQAIVSCREFAGQMQAYFAGRKPDLVIMSADWLEYARPPRFDGMIADLRTTLAKLDAWGIRVVLLGPAVQFRSRLPAMLLRAHLRGAEVRADDVLLPDVFVLDKMMQAALPAREGFSYVSVLDAVCPERQCPVTVNGGVPLTVDYAHLTAEGSAYVTARLLPRLGLKLSSVVPGRVEDANSDAQLRIGEPRDSQVRKGAP